MPVTSSSASAYGAFSHKNSTLETRRPSRFIHHKRLMMDYNPRSAFQQSSFWRDPQTSTRDACATQSYPKMSSTHSTRSAGLRAGFPFSPDVDLTNGTPHRAITHRHIYAVTANAS